jgi:hypothetical protein
MNEKLIVTRVSEQDEVYRVQNNSHEDPSEHTYQLFLQDGEPVHCECPSWEYHDGECKHMQAVVDRLEARKNWRDRQVVQREKEEDERKQAMEAARERPQQEQVILHEFADNDPADPDTVVLTDEPTPSEQVDLDEAVERSEQEQAVLESARELLDQWDVTETAKETKESMMSKDEWRSMSSEGRSRLAAWL